tara:strand:- start:6972 stop:7994 length:1023 start_codon:yes stop_codon:yes gene_type:complete
MAEESKLVEEVLEETNEATSEASFDPTSFLGDSVNPEVVNQSVDNSEKESEPMQNEVTENVDSDDFSWDSVEVEEKTVEPIEAKSEKTEEELDWDEEDKIEEPEAVAEKATQELDWESIGKEAGIEASSKEEFIQQIKEAMKPAVEDNDAIKNLSSFLDMSDRDLVVADMRAAKYSDDDIEDTIDRLDSSGLLKREATLVRQQLTKHIHSEKDRIRNEQVKAEKNKTEDANKSRKDLQNFIKNKDDFFGGKVSQKDKKQLYGYITKGKFAQDVFESHANVAEAAFLWQNKEKIFKMIKTQGVEQGKSKVLDGITSPSRNNRSSNSFEAPSKGFDPNKFMS